MDVAAALYPWLTSAMLVTALVTLVLRIRDPELHYDLQVGIYLSGRVTRVVYVTGLVLAAVVHVLLGVAFLGIGYSWAWGFFPLAVISLVILGYVVHLASLPLDYPHEEPDDP